MDGNTENDSFLEDALEQNEEEITAPKVLQIIEQAWLNEKFSPEILPHKLEYVECMLEQIKYMESNIASLPKDDIKVDMHKIELERIRYILASYLRCRIRKIEKFALYILEQESQRGVENLYLSEAELKFAREYVQNMDNHFDTVLKQMPWNLQTLDMSKKRIKPDNDIYVFLKSNQNIENVVIKNLFENKEEEIKLTENSQHILPYSVISNFVKSGSIQLI